MPVINIDLGLGQANEEQKKQLIERFTRDAVEVTGIAVDKFVILINELPHENIGVGGKSLKTLKMGH
ncbi:4-oxalocrotonate tautomerase family protein [Pseudaeromonas sp. ZJS20]|uniref:tautomerase family protein n=1 Tax=Pseudaeromonas aegiceratis TaxID=3153928 RepID=UPI00390CC11D